MGASKSKIKVAIIRTGDGTVNFQALMGKQILIKLVADRKMTVVVYEQAVAGTYLKDGVVRYCERKLCDEKEFRTIKIAETFRSEIIFYEYLENLAL